MKRGSDVPGNSRASELEYQRAMLRAAEQLMRFERVAERLDDQDCWLRSITVRLPGEARNTFLAVVRADNAGAPVVSFHEGDTLLECLRGMVARLENGSVKWKDDQYGKG